LPYGKASELFMPVRYNAMTGKGEQRDINPAHLRKLKRAMEAGEYTPTPGSVGLRKKHREALVIEASPGIGETFRLTVNSDGPLPLTDAGHRMEALALLVKETKAEVEKAKDDKGKAEARAKLDEILALPLTFTVHLDGDSQRDFVNLQEGRPVDPAHLFS